MDKLSAKTGRLINSVNESMQTKQKSIGLDNEEVVLSEEAIIILTEVDKLRRMMLNIQREMRNTIQEEFTELSKHSTLISEGKGDEINVTLGGHHFKGNVRIVKK